MMQSSPDVMVGERSMVRTDKGLWVPPSTVTPNDDGTKKLEGTLLDHSMTLTINRKMRRQMAQAESRAARSRYRKRNRRNKKIKAAGLLPPEDE